MALPSTGYFIVPAAGDYLLQTTSDDFGYIWVGKKAINQWNKSDYDGSVNTSSTSVFFNSGGFVPTTFIYANGGGFCASVFGITFPNGTQLNGNFGSNFLQPLATDSWVPTPKTKCSAPLPHDKNNFRIFYAGSGYSLDPTNPSTDNGSHPRIIKNYQQGARFADVLQDCEAQANTYGYMTVDIHYSISANYWSHGYLSGANGDVSFVDCTPNEPTGVTRFFEGFATNIHSTMFPPDCQLTLDDGYSYLDACQAALACTSDAFDWGYPTVELYFQESNSSWVCVEYFAPYNQGSYFNVTNSTLGQVFGFTVH